MRTDDVHARVLEPVAKLCAEAGVPVRVGVFRPTAPDATGAPQAPVAALRCTADDDSWDAVVTAVRGQRRSTGAGGAGTGFARDPRTGYDLNSPGELVYEVQIRENDDGLGGHGPRPIVVFRLFEQPRAAADELILWHRRAGLFTVVPPVEDPKARLRRERRRFEHRTTAADAAEVRITDLPPNLVEAAAAIDPAALCFHFPRDRSGRYFRSVVVALARDPAIRPHVRTRWLTARAGKDGLVVGAADLISANQPHRWDLTPWLWHRDHAGAARTERWQVARPDDAAPVMAAVGRSAWPDAFAAAGVAVEPDLVRILNGVPHRSYRAEVTGTWVANLYTGLTDLAPWRLAEAYRTWHDERTRHGLTTRDPVVLFGLGGLGTARKPKVALDHGPLLRLTYTGGNAVLPHALWTVPADLAAHLYGFAPY
ncbi:hypothetical protein [Virgisporangium aurantiacum]|uniref:hypothetical protein n=1 Tax=Virgisporangium aurantiacum TaxID=175570 RepID=UPI00195068F6|nr:hypothetical protein [Virgisporangium aurantiacum]